MNLTDSISAINKTRKIKFNDWNELWLKRPFPSIQFPPNSRNRNNHRKNNWREKNVIIRIHVLDRRLQHIYYSIQCILCKNGSDSSGICACMNTIKFLIMLYERSAFDFVKPFNNVFISRCFFYHFAVNRTRQSSKKNNTPWTRQTFVMQHELWSIICNSTK